MKYIPFGVLNTPVSFLISFPDKLDDADCLPDWNARLAVPRGSMIASGGPELKLMIEANRNPSNTLSTQPPRRRFSPPYQKSNARMQAVIWSNKKDVICPRAR
jgi:hypothetical protein